MERGELAATEDKFLAFAKGLSEMANANGALEAVTKKTRAEMNRFFNSLNKGKDAIFQGGMNEGLSYMFGTFATIVEDLTPALKAFGGAFKGMISVVTAAVKLVVAPFNVLIDLFSYLSGSDATTKGIWTIIGAGGTLALLASRFKLITTVLKGVNIQLLVMMGRIATMVAPLVLALGAIEDLYSWSKGRGSLVGDAFGNRDSTRERNLMQSSGWADFIPMVSWYKMYNAHNATNIEVTVKDSELSKVIEAKVVGHNQQQMATTAAGLGG